MASVLRTCFGSMRKTDEILHHPDTEGKAMAIHFIDTLNSLAEHAANTQPYSTC